MRQQSHKSPLFYVSVIIGILIAVTGFTIMIENNTSPAGIVVGVILIWILSSSIGFTIGKYDSRRQRNKKNRK
jgi:hypothetical protein